MTSAAAASAAATASSRNVAIVSCAASSLIRMLGLPAIIAASIENPLQVNCLLPRFKGHSVGRFRDVLMPATKASKVCHLKVLSYPIHKLTNFPSRKSSEIVRTSAKVVLSKLGSK